MWESASVLCQILIVRSLDCFYIFHFTDKPWTDNENNSLNSLSCNIIWHFTEDCVSCIGTDMTMIHLRNQIYLLLNSSLTWAVWRMVGWSGFWVWSDFYTQSRALCKQLWGNVFPLRTLCGNNTGLRYITHITPVITGLLYTFRRLRALC